MNQRRPTTRGARVASLLLFAAACGRRAAPSDNAGAASTSASATTSAASPSAAATASAKPPTSLRARISLSPLPPAPSLPTAKIANPPTKWARAELEVPFAVPAGIAPDDIELRAIVQSPGAVVEIGGAFYAHGAFRVRFLPREEGTHTYRIQRLDGGTAVDVAAGTFEVGPAAHDAHGSVRVDAYRPRQLVREDGSPFVALGETRGTIWDPKSNEGGAKADAYVAAMAKRGMTTLRLFDVASGAGVKTGSGSLERSVGRFDEIAADALDEIFEAADKSDIAVIFTVYANGFKAGESWELNPYNVKNGGPVDTPTAFFSSPTAHDYSRKKLRYILDRYSAYSSFFAIDLLDEPENDGPIAEATWVPWAMALASDIRGADPRGHLITVGSLGQMHNVAPPRGAPADAPTSELPWYASTGNGLLQFHLTSDEPEPPPQLAAAMSRHVSELWRHEKPTICGAFAHVKEDAATFDHTHVGLWAAALNGAGALVQTAPATAGRAGQPMTDARARHFKVLRESLARLPWSTGVKPRRDTTPSVAGTQVFAMVGDDESKRLVWVVAPVDGYGKPVSGLKLTTPGLSRGTYTIRWFDDVSGATVATSNVVAEGAAAEIAVPTFSRHVAAWIEKAK